MHPRSTGLHGKKIPGVRCLINPIVHVTSYRQGEFIWQRNRYFIWLPKNSLYVTYYKCKGIL